MEIQDFLQKLTQLHRAKVPGKGMAPHKPVLLLAVAGWFDLHQPVEAVVPFDEDLVRLFRRDWG